MSFTVQLRLLDQRNQRARSGPHLMLRSFLTLARERYLISTRRLSVTAYSFVLFFVVNSGSETRGRDFFAGPLANLVVGRKET